VTSSLSSPSLPVRPRGAGFARIALGMSLAASLLFGCGGAAKGPAEPDKPAAPQPQDLVIAVDKPVALTGVQWQPDALGRPSLKFVEVKNKKLDVEKQRNVYKKAKANQKQAEAQILVALIYQSIRGEKDPAKARALVDEARTTLRDARGIAGDQVQQLTLHNLASLEIGAGDFAAASELYKETLTRFPQGEHLTSAKAWLAYTQLRLGQNADAAKTLEGLAPAPDAPEVSYVLAWTRWRTGDFPGAAEAIKSSVTGWRSVSSRPLVERDASVMMARGGTSVDDAVKLFVDANQNQRDATYVALFKLHAAYAAAGRFGDAVVILDRAAARVGEKIPVQDQAKFYIQQANYVLRATLDPAKFVEFQKKALETYAVCADKCTKEEHEEGAATTRDYGKFFDGIFRTSRDERFYEPALALYALYVALPNRPDTAEVTRYVEEAKASKAAAEAPPGKHDPGFMLPLLGLHDVDVQACYENVLITEPTVGGELSFTAEINVAGEVTGVSTDPAAGAAGLAKVAGCVAERAKAWKFPTRTLPGTTRLTGKYTLAPAAGK
jgi:tetratricopeptide (TPR) repeat protein